MCLLRGTDWIFIYRLKETNVVVIVFTFHILDVEILDVLRLLDSVGHKELKAGWVFDVSKILSCVLIHCAV